MASCQASNSLLCKSQNWTLNTQRDWIHYKSNTLLSLIHKENKMGLINRGKPNETIYKIYINIQIEFIPQDFEGKGGIIIRHNDYTHATAIFSVFLHANCKDQWI